MKKIEKFNNEIINSWKKNMTNRIRKLKSWEIGKYNITEKWRNVKIKETSKG